MILFIFSFLLVFTSSYLLTSLIAPKKSPLGIIYLFLIAFAQIVLTFEILSLFSAIRQHWMLLFNLTSLSVSVFIWNKKSRPLWNFDYKNFRNRFLNSLKLDKSLMLLYIGFCVLIFSAFTLCLLMPITNDDAASYHVARSLFWVLQGSLQHFQVADIRNLCLPINSEIIYAWIILFLKKDALIGFPSFVGYLLSIISIYNIMGYLGYCVRKRLWVIFILSSFSSVIVQMSSTETDIIIAGLVLSSIFLFWNGLKTDNKTPIYMAALAYALALGTKTPSLIMVPGVAFFMLMICAHYKKYKQFLWFLGFGIINFTIFSSYNYILNYLHFSNFLGTENFMTVSKNYYGIKGLFANFIKYWFMFIDFTGFKWGIYLDPIIQITKNTLLHSFNLLAIPDGMYTANFFTNGKLLEPTMGAGVLGLLVFIPCLAWSCLKAIFKFKKSKVRFLLFFAIMFIINLIMLSYLLAYMAFSIRFLMAFIVVSSPIIVYSYTPQKTLLKYIIIIFSIYYMTIVSTHLWPRPFVNTINILIKKHSITYLRDLAECKGYDESPLSNDLYCVLNKKIQKNFDKENPILIFVNNSKNIYSLKSLEFEGYKIDMGTMEDIKETDLNKYKIIVFPPDGQASTVIKDFEKRKTYYKRIKNDIVILKNDSVPCLYIHNPQIPESYNKVPYQVDCKITKSFINDKNLNFLNATGIIDPVNKKLEYYTFYENKNFRAK